MPELRRDPILRRWVAIAQLPEKDKKESCPFCAGNESLTPPEVFSIRESGTLPNNPGWQVRVVSNRYPLFRLEGGLGKRAEGMYDLMNNFGAHEIVVDTPDHLQNWPQMDVRQIEKIIMAYRQRSLDLRGDDRFRQILITKHHGLPPSPSPYQSHHHSHIIAMPVIPLRIEEEIKGTLEYYQRKDRCGYCDSISHEIGGQKRVILETDEFLNFVPFASRFPYENWVIPKRHLPDFGLITDSQIVDLAGALKSIFTRLHKIFPEAIISMVLHSSPVQEYFREEYHWHIELRPRTERPVGFEWGTGFFINYVSPEEAAVTLRDT